MVGSGFWMGGDVCKLIKIAEDDPNIERKKTVKAMAVTGLRLEAVRYKQEIDRYIREKGYAIKSLVAFSGSVEDDKIPKTQYTEVEMNGGLKEKDLPDFFAKPGLQRNAGGEKIPERLWPAVAASQNETL